MGNTAKHAITRELEQLRLKPGPLDAQKMIYAPVLVKGLGGDDPELALERLLNLAQEHSADRDIDAAFYVMGHGAMGETVLAKHTEWAMAHFADERTARRYTNAGIAKIVMLVMGPAPWLQPTATQELRQQGDLVTVCFRLQLPPDIAMRELEVFVNEEPQKVDLEREERPHHLRSYRSSSYSLLDTTAITGESTLRLRWRGEKPPEYRQIVGPGLRATVRTRLARWEMWTFTSLNNQPYLNAIATS